MRFKLIIKKTKVMYMVEKSGKLLCRIVLIMLLFVLCFCASCGHKEARYALGYGRKTNVG